MSHEITVGCIGLGNMGAGIAKNIVGAGYETNVFDVRPEAVDSLVKVGAKRTATLDELASNCDIVTLCVLNDQQVTDVLTRPDGVFSALAPGGVVIIHSTASPATCQAMAVAAAEYDCQVVDAPISGGESAANDGTLTLMIGGEESAFIKCQGVFEAISASRFYVGDVGAGQVAKVVNNLMGIVNRIVIGEGLTLARGAGLLDDAILEVVRSSTGNSWQVEQWRTMQAIASGSTSGPEGMAKMCKKDLGLAIALAESLNIPLPVTITAAERTAQLFTEVG